MKAKTIIIKTKEIKINTEDNLMVPDLVMRHQEEITDNEYLILLFKLLLEEEISPFINYDKIVEIGELKRIFSLPQNMPDLDFEQRLHQLLGPVQADKDFYIKHNMENYKPNFIFSDNYPSYCPVGGAILFYNFSDDFINAYMEDRLGIKTGTEASNNQNQKVILQKAKKKQLQLQDLPSNLKWEEITIRFLNNNEAQITARELVYQVSYELMGFQDEKSKKPNFQWNLLKLLSLKNGYLNWDNNRELDIKARDRIKKQKQELLERLKVYFHTVEGDPFFNYREESGYKIKIQLIPEQDSEIGDTIKAIGDTVDYYDEDNDVNIEDYLQK